MLILKNKLSIASKSISSNLTSLYLIFQAKNMLSQAIILEVNSV